jgi:uncharacterized protein (TIGR02001 family)
MRRPALLLPALFLLSLLPALIAAPACALDLSGDARLVSDYRFRGISRSDVRPAVQGSLDVGLGNFRAGVFASSLKAPPAGADAEITLSAGYSRPLGLGTLDLGLSLYTFPGSRFAASVIEADARLRGAIGPLQLTAGAAWAPAQAGLRLGSGARASSLHGWGAAHVDVLGTPLSLNARLGHTRGVPALIGGRALSGTARLWDWRLGADYALGPLTLGAALVGTDLGRARAEALGLARPGGRTLAGTGVVVSLSAGF